MADEPGDAPDGRFSVEFASLILFFLSAGDLSVIPLGICPLVSFKLNPATDEPKP
jgi:hypothetical protein